MALTPEVRGVTIREYSRNRPLHTRALLRRRSDEAAIVLGGRNLGGPCSTGALVSVRLDGRDVQQFAVRAGESFVRLWRLPAGSLTGDSLFAELEIAARDRSGAGQQVDVAFEQFDIQTIRQPIVGLGDGRFEPEYEPRDGIAYRWMSEHATLHIDAFDRDVRLRIRGESPRRSFAQSSVIMVRAGDAVLDTRKLDGDFEIETVVTAKVLQEPSGRIEIEASQSFVPDERSGNGDRRALALRVFGVDVRARDLRH